MSITQHPLKASMTFLCKLFLKSSLTMCIFLLLAGCTGTDPEHAGLTDGQEIILSKEELKDKIMGGWAGQVIGCTYGGPTEFRFKGSMIPDNHFIPWYDGVFRWWYENAPGLYDDIYMDLTFVEVFEAQGLDAPVDSFATAFANADYMLWHANQAARYNILNGIMPPESGYWKSNPHADDIDFQIEADFAGIMSPGMVNTATEISDGIGHIMNYGDGWYGGVYVAAMYALAYVSEDVDFIVTEALKAIPAESSFYKLQKDVIEWYRKYPDDWKMTWYLTQKKWAAEVGCPDGVYADFNIDAKINSAYIIIGLLYGGGDFGETVRISTLCGQDSDCNPASAAGILGVMRGYSNIPDPWKPGLEDVEELDFRYTDISLNDAYAYSFGHALQVIGRNGGSSDDENVTILYQEPIPVRLEQGFEGHHPAEFANQRVHLNADLTAFTFEFSGNGFVISGGCPWGTDASYTGKVEVMIDGKLHETADIPADYRKRRYDLTWAYGLEEGAHTVRVKLLNPTDELSIETSKFVVYSSIDETRTQPTIRIVEL